MIRLLLLLLLAYLFFRIVKAVFSLLGGGDQELKRGRDEEKVIDEMVQDPSCKTYIPRREAIRKVVQGQEYFFCSKECARKFEAEGER
jgi:YHS domain-containing protein